MAQTKFKVGDRVVDEDFGKGTVIFNDGTDLAPYEIEFDEVTGFDIEHCKPQHGMHLDERYLTLITE
jgi:hypothetical protein